MTASTWPTHEDGTNKTFGEMTPEEKRCVLLSAAKRREDAGDLLNARTFRDFADKVIA